MFDIIGSIRKFFNMKRCFCIEQSKKTGEIRDAIGSIRIDSFSGRPEEVTYPEHQLNDGYTVWVHAYSSKEAKAIALQRINKHKAEMSVEKEAERHERMQTTTEMSDRLNVTMELLKEAAENWTPTEEPVSTSQGYKGYLQQQNDMHAIHEMMDDFRERHQPIRQILVKKI